MTGGRRSTDGRGRGRRLGDPIRVNGRVPLGAGLGGRTQFLPPLSLPARAAAAYGEDDESFGNCPENGSVWSSIFFPPVNPLAPESST